MQTVYGRGGSGGGSQQKEVADGADVVFTDTGPVWVRCGPVLPGAVNSHTAAQISSHHSPIYVQPPQMLAGGNNLDTAALATRSVLHKRALVNVLENAANQTRGIF